MPAVTFTPRARPRPFLKSAEPELAHTHEAAPSLATLVSWYAAFATVVAISVYASSLIESPAGTIALFWPVDGVIIAAQLVGPRRYLWATGIVGALASQLTSMAIFGSSPSMKIWLMLALFMQTTTTASLLGRDREWVSGRDDGSRPWLRFAFIGVLVIPSLYGVVCTLVLRAFDQTTNVVGTFLEWTLSIVLGIALVVPVVLRWRPRFWRKRLRSGRVLELSLLLVTTIVATQLVFEQPHFLYLFALFPLVVSIIFRAGVPGLTLATIAVATIVLSQTLAGNGPFAALRTTAIEVQLTAQAFVLLLMTSFYFIAGLLHDRQKARTRELREVAQRAQLIEQLPAGALLVRDDALEANLEAERITGHPRDELRTLSAWLAILADDPGDARARIDASRAANFPTPLLVAIHRKDGAARLIELAGRRVDATGDIWLMRDVTEVQAANEAVREREERLSILNERMQLATQTGRIGIYETDSNNNVVWDRVMYDLYGRTEDEFDGTLAHWMTFLRGDAHVLSAQRDLSDAKEGTSAFDREFQIERPDGTLRTLRTFALVIGEPGTPQRGVGCSWDVTAERELNAALVEAKQAAEAANRAKSEFLANMSHEIRTPMNGVLGMAALALETRLDNDQREQVETIRYSAQSLLTIIDDILDFSKIEANKLSLDPHPFALRRNLGEALRTVAVVAREKGLALEWSVGVDVPEFLVGDWSRIRQILFNLVGNAVKFTSRGSVTVAVSVEGQVFDDLSLQISVRDTGPGIAADRLGSIFDPFVQADGSTARRFGGTGLGLSITSRLVRMMGGTITVDSELGRGSTFRLVLRLPRSAAPVLQEVTKPIRAIAPMNILVAEDNIVNQRVMQLMLERAGHRVVLATDGHEAIARYFERDVDLVLMDVQMPRLDGLEATRQIRAHEAGSRRTPIIAVTAHAMAGDRERFLAAGMDDYITKPIRRDELFEVLELFIPPGLADTVEASTERRYDEDAALARFAGDRMLLGAAIDLFLEQGPQQMRDLAAALEAEDAPAVEHIAHSLRGVLAFYGAPRAVRTAHEMEIAASAGQVKHALTLWPEVDAEVGRLRSELEQNKRRSGQRV